MKNAWTMVTCVLLLLSGTVSLVQAWMCHHHDADQTRANNLIGKPCSYDTDCGKLTHQRSLIEMPCTCDGNLFGIQRGTCGVMYTEYIPRG